MNKVKMKKKNTATTKSKYIPGSRIPMSILFDYIMDGYTIHDFISAYPWIKKSAIQKSLKEFKNKDYPQKHAF